MKMKDMKCSGRSEMAMAMPEKSEYPYGLQINLNHECLEKLGIKEMPEVGTEMMIHAMVKVCSVTMNANEGGENNHMSLQICEMGVEGGKKSKAEVFYK